MQGFKAGALHETKGDSQKLLRIAISLCRSRRSEFFLKLSNAFILSLKGFEKTSVDGENLFVGGDVSGNRLMPIRFTDHLRDEIERRDFFEGIKS
jgi:hypothetical protein